MTKHDYFWGGLMLGAPAGALCVALLACTARDTARTAYEVQSKACLVAYDDGAHQKSCLEYVRSRWTEAGAPVAVVLDAGSIVDGGSHE